METADGFPAACCPVGIASTGHGTPAVFRFLFRGAFVADCFARRTRKCSTQMHDQIEIFLLHVGITIEVSAFVMLTTRECKPDRWQSVSRGAVRVRPVGLVCLPT